MQHSASQCGTACVAQVIQSTQEASQSARSAATSVASIVTAIEDMRTIVEDDQQTTESIEGQVIQLRIDMQDLSDEISSLRISVDNSMVPTIDNNILKLVIAVLTAFTLCIVVCQLVIFYSGRLEVKKEGKRRNKQNRIDVI